jgi:DUF1365 family protein
MTIRSSLYVGSVFHHRMRPHAHKLRYGVFWMLVDLEEVSTIAGKLRFFSHNRFNLPSFHDADHGNGSRGPLGVQIRELLQREGISSEIGRIDLLCMPRILGYGFNPLSVYFCYRSDGSLAVIIYEVHNTFGERHSYIIPCKPADCGRVEQRCAKAFFVSPFLDMDMHYSFRVDLPAETVSVTVRGDDQKGPLILASLAGSKQALDDKSLLRLMVSHPLMTVRVIAAIHWHALRMILKGFRLRRHVSAPRRLATVVSSADVV